MTYANQKSRTSIEHVAKPGANVFADLGFTPDEALRLQAEARKQIRKARTRKQKSTGQNPSDQNSTALPT
jgi:hypothetical protein